MNNIPLVDLAAAHAEVAEEVEAGFKRVIAETAFIGGTEVSAFEREYASFAGVPHCVGVANGTDAVELALRAVGVGPGSEVALPANTFVATAEAVARTGAGVVPVDVNPLTYLVDVDAALGAVSGRTRAIVPVHLYGQPADLDGVMALAARHNLVVIEDAAQAHGARYKGRRAGSIGHAAAFSFYPSKNLGAIGDGGLITTNHDDAAAKIRLLRNYGQRVKYHHSIAGTNSRLDTVQAAVLRIKLPHLDGWNAARRRHSDAYTSRLAGLVQTPAIAAGIDHIFHLYVIETDQRDALQAALKARQIDTGIHYPVPAHLQEACAPLGYRAGAFPATEAAASRILSLPMYAELSEAQIEHVADTIRGART
jgi:dTDP-4-amino-4,6-dideoxygalactose transaminase